MCLILVAQQLNPSLPVLILANRDEFYSRATAPAEFWPESPGMVAGRDLVGGGSWLAVRGQRWAAVTNVREGLCDHDAPKLSRGWLVRDYLQGQLAPQDYLSQVMAQAQDYAGFNLLLGEAGRTWYCSNRGPKPQLLAPGLYGLSNHLLDTPWPKVTAAKRRLNDWLAKPNRQPDQALSLLADTRFAEDAELPVTGVPLEWERALSAMFISTPEYGTRCTTLLIWTVVQGGLLVERRYLGSPQRWTQRHFVISETKPRTFTGQA